MTVTRDVILDLLPMYTAGQVTADTKALVEEFLKSDPDFTRMSERFDAVVHHRPAPEAAAERRTFEYLRRRLRWRNRAIGLAVAFSLMPFSFGFHGSHIDWILLRDQPAIAASWLAAAVACWIASYALGPRAPRAASTP